MVSEDALLTNDFIVEVLKNDDSKYQPFTAPDVMLAINCLLKIRNITIRGTVASNVAFSLTALSTL